MKEQKKLNKGFNIKVPFEILSNKELSENEKLILSLDYTFNSKKKFNVMTHIDVGELFSLHPNIVGLCRKSLIAKGYLIKDNKDKRIYYLTDKLKKFEIPKIDEEAVISLCIIPFEIYNHTNLTTGSKLLWGEYNTMSNSQKGYFKKRTTTSEKMNISIGSITNWTKQLFTYGFLEEYEVKSEYYGKQKFVRTIKFKREKPVDELDNVFDNDVISNSKKSKSVDDYKSDILGPI
ncbi:hypothetical protein [Flavobacterium sp.]|uniref:hypothetical protein n=1 Tax=Flavobacterium sp. TaxID=239 RepID=UPI0025D86195|nr:hypothetical protein [Flavobacterium sp.]